MNGEPALSASQLAKRWKISAPTVRAWWRAGIIPAPRRAPGCTALRWRLSDIERFEREAVDAADRQEA
jgi:DNA-binding transcriptional MerR regulator